MEGWESAVIGFESPPSLGAAPSLRAAQDCTVNHKAFGFGTSLAASLVGLVAFLSVVLCVHLGVPTLGGQNPRLNFLKNIEHFQKNEKF